MEERTRTILIGAGALLFLAAVIVTVLSFPKEGGDGDQWEEPEIKLVDTNVTVIDAFTTDRVTGVVTPPLFTMNFLVLDISISNPLNENVTLFFKMIDLVTTGETYGPNLMDRFVGRSFHSSQNLTPFSSVSGLLHFNIFPHEKPLFLEYIDATYNLTFSVNLSGLVIDHRPWETPLEFRITGCGRDEEGSGREQYLFFLLEVNDPTPNASHFQCWLIDLECINGVKLDGLFVEQPEDYVFLPGWNVTYKVYFDIPRGSPDMPKVLYQDVEGIYLDVDEVLYEGLI